MSSTSAGSVLRIATRKSPLALWQAEHVAALLRGAHPGLGVELEPMSTQGDRIQDRSLAAIGGKGLFIKELEVALEERRADIAVHSMKDVPAEMPEGFVIAAFLARADPRDALLCRRGNSLNDLPAGAKLGTSSLRRSAQILAARPDISIEPLRGNVDTRLSRLENGGLDAIVLACAGLVRLGLESRITSRLAAGTMLPAVGQGAIGIECRSEDARTRALVAALDDAATHTALAAERTFARTLGGSCQSPIAALARIEADRLTLQGLVAEPDGSRLLRDSVFGSCTQAEELGEELARRLLDSGARELLERLRSA
jgi:hydroxymethylbilane synthase